MLPQKGSPFYVCPAFEEGRAREQIANAPEGENPDVRIWQEDQSPYHLIAQGLKDLGISKLGLEETVRFVFAEGISKASAQTTITSATPVTAGCRMIKSAHEIALMRLAAHVTLAAYEATYQALKDGMTQPQVEELVRQAHQQLGFTGDADVQVGRILCVPARLCDSAGDPRRHNRSDGRRLHGRRICFRHHANICAGQGEREDEERFDIVHRAQSAALATARPGVECGAIDAAARKVVTDGGYGPDYKYFTHRLGHGMGMDGHEWPYLVRGNKTKLQANMTTSDEPGIYIRGEFGIRLEDDMHVTENGAELFTPQSPSLEDPFAKA